MPKKLNLCSPKCRGRPQRDELITLPIPRLNTAAAGRQVRRQRLRTATDNLLERILDMQSEDDMVVTRLRDPFTEFFRHEK